MPDQISSAIHVALTGLSERRRIIGDNIANVQTPGFLAGTTDFESSLTSALNGGNVSTSGGVRGKSLAPTRTDGNNVDIDNETIAATDTGLRYNAMIEAMNMKFRTLRAAIG